MSTLFPGLSILVIANAQEADSDNELVVNFFQAVPAWVWALCFVVLALVCVGSFCACRQDVMMRIEAEMMSDAKWTDEVFFAMHKCDPPVSPQSENVSPKQSQKKHGIPIINFTEAFTTANLKGENNKESGQKNPMHMDVFWDADSNLSNITTKMINAYSVHSQPRGVCFDDESFERVSTDSRKEKTPDFQRAVSVFF